MSTIKDVAKLAGVSPSTVSRVLSGEGPSAASEKTKEKIWEAVRVTGYSVNESARKLRKKENGTKESEQAVDFILARELDYFLDPFLSSLRRVIEENLFKRGYRVRSQLGLPDIKTQLSAVRKEKGSAVILGRIDMQSLKVLKNTYQNLIYAGLQDLELGIDSVICSGYDAVATAMDYLVSMGHSKICYIGETKSEQRYNAYLDKVREHGIANSKDLIIDVLFTPSDSYYGLKKALDHGLNCTAIICANDVSAVGVLKALKEARIAVPEEISIIGINDVENIRYLEPMLTTMSIPAEEMGGHVAKLLIDRIEKSHNAPVKLYIPSSLVKRDSCAGIR